MPAELLFLAFIGGIIVGYLFATLAKKVGTNGDDSIRNTGSNVTIDGGTGDDTIDVNYGNSIHLIYHDGDGNDTAICDNTSNGDSEIILELASGTLGETVMTEEGDIVLNIGENNLLI